MDFSRLVDFFFPRAETYEIQTHGEQHCLYRGKQLVRTYSTRAAADLALYEIATDQAEKLAW